MTTAERDVETAREALVAALDYLHQERSFAALDRIHFALRAIAALNGDAGEEVWGASGNDVRSEPHGRIVATCGSPEIARRIASDHNRLPKLERAAQAVEKWWLERGFKMPAAPNCIFQIRAALAGEQGT